MMPEVMDYGVHWIETKAGEANQKTGIPPSLYTLRASDFLLGPGQTFRISHCNLLGCPRRSSKYLKGLKSIFKALKSS